MKEFSLSTLSAALIGALMAAMCLPVLAQESRTLPVTVVDKDGKVVEGLTPANFRAEYRGSLVEVSSAGINAEPRVIGIAVDTSASLKDVFKGPANWQLAAELVAQFSPQHRVGLYSFASGAYLEVEPTQDKQQLLDKIDALAGLPIKGPTAYWDAVYAIARSYPRDEFGNIIYLITDGIDSVSRVEQRAVEDSLLSSGIRVIVLCLPAQLGFEGQDCLRFPKISGGYTISVPDRRKITIPQLLRHMDPYHQYIERVYAVELEIPTSVVKRRKIGLKVVDENGKKMKGVKVHYPRYLVPTESGQ